MRGDINNSRTNHNLEAAASATHLLHTDHLGQPRDVLAADEISRTKSVPFSRHNPTS